MSERPTDPTVPAGLSRAHAALAQRLHLRLREDEMLECFAEVLREAFPGRLVCLRLVDGARSLSLVYATGRLKPETRERFRLAGVEDPAAPAERLAACGIVRAEAYEPVFVDGQDGIAVALHDGAEVFGVLNVEWTGDAGLSPAEQDGVVGLGRYLATALDGSRLRAENTHLRDRMDKLLDHADAPIVVLDGAGRIRMFNRCLERLSGRSRADTVGREFAELVAPEDRVRLLAVLAGALRGRPTANYELRLPRVSGAGPLQLSFNLAPVLGSGGEDVEEIVAVGQDLTELRRLQRQMIHTEKLATIGQLAAGVVHEINNPLTSVSIHADYLAKLMAREQRSQQEVTFINRIRDAAARILRFTQDLMSFARPTGDEPEQLDLAAVLDQAAAFCEHVIARSGVTLERRFEAAPKVYGIRGQLQQVFINLITNACHAMGTVERERRLTLSVTDHGDGRVRAEVRDTGTGIPEEIRDEIFEPFFTTKGEGEGTGLGLSIVHNIIDNHQAEIRVESEVGRGTGFILLFYAA
jgi:two-component system, NtrC family, sensor kinase